ncbi:MAG: LysR family transcriptional regulator [Caulobacteraceae bacterium]
MTHINPRRVDLNLLRVFDAIYSERHVTRAAARLATSQSAVSHSLRNLRHAFKDPLFMRTPGGMTPTALADELAQRIGSVLGEMDDIFAASSDFDPQSAEGKITIGLLLTPPPWLLPRLCAAVRREAPGLSIAFRMIAPEQVAAALDDRSMQIIVGTPDNVFDRRRFSYEPLFKDQLACIVDRKHAAAGTVLDFETYAALPHIVMATGAFVRTWIDEVLAEHGLSRTIRIMVPNPTEIGNLLADSDMVSTIIPSLILPDPRLVALTPPFGAVAVEIGQFWHGRDDGAAQSLWLRSHLLEICSQALGAMPPPSGAAL